MSIPLIWTQGMNDSQKAEFQKLLMNSTQLLKQLANVIDNLENSLERSELTQTAYDNPNWVYRQAHLNGQRHSLKTLKDLVSIKG